MTGASKWIWGADPAQPDEYFDFLIPFAAEPGADYSLRLSCDSDYALWRNGELVSFGQYPDYIDYKVYDEIPLTGLNNGKNELLVTVWYYGIDSQTYIKKPAGLRYELLKNGEVMQVSSAATPSRRNANYIPHREQNITYQLGLGFAYDCKPVPGGFGPSVEVNGLPDQLFPRPIRKLAIEDRMPMQIIRQGGFRKTVDDKPAQWMQKAELIARDSLKAETGEDGVFLLIDLGAETCGFLDIDIDVPCDCEIHIGWGEHLIDGRCRTHIRDFAVEYHAKAGRNAYMNPFRRFGCRYLQLFVFAPAADVHYAGIRPTMYPLNIRPWHTDDPLRQRIYDTCVRTLQMCMHDHYEDCPWREQALYALDSRNQMLCGYHTFGETAFPRACLELISHGMRPDGLLAICYPAGMDFPIPSFSLVYFIQMREYLDYSGDVEFLRSKYDFLWKLMNRFLSQPRENGLIENFYGEGGFWNFYEWSDGMSGRFNEQQRSIEAPLNAYLSLALQNLAAIARRLGKHDDAERCMAESANLNCALVDFFFDPTEKLFASFNDRCHDQFSVLTNSLCLLCGAAEGLDKSRILEILAVNGEGIANVVPNTLSMNFVRFDALLKEDRAKYAPVILAEIDRVYSYMLERGATTFWETILGDQDFDLAGSLCHGWSALPAYYYATLL